MLGLSALSRICARAPANLGHVPNNKCIILHEISAVGVSVAHVSRNTFLSDIPDGTFIVRDILEENFWLFNGRGMSTFRITPIEDKLSGRCSPAF